MNEHDATELAFKNGYKKAAREIFAEIDNAFRKMMSVAHDGITRGIAEQDDVALSVNSDALTILDTARLCIAELKKKYTGEKV